jgi:hypothetical protein
MATAYKLTSALGNPVNIRPPSTFSVTPSSFVPNLRCPHCMHMGAFTAIVPNDAQITHIVLKANSPISNGSSTIGIRVCPNIECRGLVLVVIDRQGVIALPNEVLDFDSTDIPAPIAASLEEAIKCHLKWTPYLGPGVAEVKV